MNLDLHIHSTFSDGFLHPQEIVAKAVENNIRVISLTDHDCVTGIGEALRAAEKFANKIKIIPGVELSTKLSDKYTEKASVHILGYFVDYKNQKFIEKLNDIRNVRVKRFVQMKEKLENLGYKVRVQINEAEKHSLGRPHLANDLVASGYFATVQDAFDELLAKDRPAYVSFDSLTQKEAVDLIHQVGGKAFLAHPVEVKSFNSVEELLSTLPFDGLEIYHPSVREEKDFSVWLELAKKYNLKISGGSDFHGSPTRFPNKLGIFMIDETKCDKIFWNDL